MLNSADYLMMPNESIRRYVLDQQLAKKPQKIAPMCLPTYSSEYLGVTRDHRNRSIREVEGCDKPLKVVFAVLGSVDPKRKRYSDLEFALSSVISQFSVPVELKLLGRIKKNTGKKVVRQFERLQSEQCQLSCSNGFIPPEELAQILAGVVFFVAPINILTNYSINKEVYGKTKISGVEGDVVRYQKPTIICSEYELPSALLDCCGQYQTIEQLSALLLCWVNQRMFEKNKSCFPRSGRYRSVP